MKRFQVPDEIAIRVLPDDMHATVEAIFTALGCPPNDSRRCADALLYADIRGIDSHGVSNMMRVYVAMLECAAMALEDSAVLVELLRDELPVEVALGRFVERRVGRVRWVQNQSRRVLPHCGHPRV